MNVLRRVGKKILVLVVILLMANTAALTLAAPGQQAEQNIAETISGDDRFTTFVAALQATDLLDDLEGQGPLTVFAPTDEAFNKISESVLDELLADTALLENLLLFHIVPGEVIIPEEDDQITANTMLNRAVTITVDEGLVIADDTSVISTNIETGNGVIHVVEELLVPTRLEGAILSNAVTGIFDGENLLSTGNRTGVELLADNQNFTTLSLLLQAADLNSTLQGEGPFTIFAPTDQAFEQFETQTDDLLNDPEALANLLRFHVVPARLSTSDMEQDRAATTLLGEPLTFTTAGNLTTVGEAQIFDPDIAVSNGLVHVIGSVLEPDTLDSSTTDKFLVGDVSLSCSRDYVVQADDWLSKIADKFYGDPLSYPAISDATNVAATLGDSYDLIPDPNLIEIGQRLCLPDADAVEALLLDDAPDRLEPILEGESTERKIYDVVVENENLTTLRTALETATLTDTLQAEEPFTLLAPTDAAFEALSATQQDDLLENVPQLKNILLYHIIPGEVSLAEISELSAADTVLDQPLEISAEGETLRIGAAQVITADIEVDNGRVHVIDTVLLPPE